MPLHRLFHLNDGDLRRLLPFFGFYVLLSMMLNVSDGLSLSLFVNRLGADRLPLVYGVIALINLGFLRLYVHFSQRLNNLQLFQWVVGLSTAVFVGNWAYLTFLGESLIPYGLFFIAREVSSTMIIMHYGNFLQDYFTRKELNRILPIVYAGGRVGGILGGLILATLASRIGTLNIALIYGAIGLLSSFALIRMKSFVLSEEHEHAEEAEAFSGILGYIRSSPLLFWLSVTSILFVLCRWVLNYEYNQFFEGYFRSDVEMTKFLGWYTAIAMTASFLMQMLLMNRLITWVGLIGAHCIFAALLSGTMGVALFPMTLASAVICRLMETEFRIGFRNPIQMLTTNLFTKKQRVRARAWLLGGVVPVGTLLASFALQGFVKQPVLQPWIPMLGFVIGVGYFLGTFGLFPAIKKLQAK